MLTIAKKVSARKFRSYKVEKEDVYGGQAVQQLGKIDEEVARVEDQARPADLTETERRLQDYEHRERNLCGKRLTITPARIPSVWMVFDGNIRYVRSLKRASMLLRTNQLSFTKRTSK